MKKSADGSRKKKIWAIAAVAFVIAVAMTAGIWKVVKSGQSIRDG